MTEVSLQGIRVLVVEDEFLLADELRVDLEDVGAQVIGPIGHLGRATHVVNTEDDIDVAVLDLNIAGHEVFPLADLLVGRGVPFVFATGYDARVLPPRFAGVPTCGKPIVQERLLALLQQTIGAKAARRQPAETLAREDSMAPSFNLPDGS